MMKVTFESARGTVSFEYPEMVTHTVHGEKWEIYLDELTEEGWRYWLNKGKRAIADGSPDADAVQRKIGALQGHGRMIGTRVTRDPVAAELAVLVTKRLVKGGMKAKDVPKLGSTVSDVRGMALEHGVPKAWLVKAEKQAKAIAELKAADID